METSHNDCNLKILEQNIWVMIDFGESSGNFCFHRNVDRSYLILEKKPMANQPCTSHKMSQACWAGMMNSLNDSLNDHSKNS